MPLGRVREGRSRGGGCVIEDGLIRVKVPWFLSGTDWSGIGEDFDVDADLALAVGTLY